MKIWRNGAVIEGAAVQPPAHALERGGHARGYRPIRVQCQAGVSQLVREQRLRIRQQDEISRSDGDKAQNAAAEKAFPHRRPSYNRARSKARLAGGRGFSLALVI
jgi:hypothetical protein